MQFKGIISGLNGYFVHAVEEGPRAIPYRLKIRTDDGTTLYVFKSLSRVSFQLQDAVVGDWVRQEAPNLSYVKRLCRLKTTP